MKKRYINLFSGQWVDLGLDNFFKLARDIGFDGVELIFRPNMVDLDKACKDTAYCQSLMEKLRDNSLALNTISAAYIGKLVGDEYDERHNTLVPEKIQGDFSAMRNWAIEEMMKVPTAAKNLGISNVQCFLGSPIWKMLYAYPKRDMAMIDNGYDIIAQRWMPILDEFKRCNIKFAFETHPTEIAYDYYSLKRLIEEFDNHEAFALNFDPSHIFWQGVDPCVFLQDFIDMVVNVHIKDVEICLDGRTGILGSHLPFGNTKRAWNFVSPGHGHINFERIIRILNENNYTGDLSIEWEDNGMDRYYGVKDAFDYVNKLVYPVSNRAFDVDSRYGS